MAKKDLIYFVLVIVVHQQIFKPKCKRIWKQKIIIMIIMSLPDNVIEVQGMVTSLYSVFVLKDGDNQSVRKFYLIF